MKIFKSFWMKKFITGLVITQLVLQPAMADVSNIMQEPSTTAPSIGIGEGIHSQNDSAQATDPSTNFLEGAPLSAPTPANAVSTNRLKTMDQIVKEVEKLKVPIDKIKADLKTLEETDLPAAQAAVAAAQQVLNEKNAALNTANANLATAQTEHDAALAAKNVAKTALDAAMAAAADAQAFFNAKVAAVNAAQTALNAAETALANAKTDEAAKKQAYDYTKDVAIPDAEADVAKKLIEFNKAQEAWNQFMGLPKNNPLRKLAKQRLDAADAAYKLAQAYLTALQNYLPIVRKNWEDAMVETAAKQAVRDQANTVLQNAIAARNQAQTSLDAANADKTAKQAAFDQASAVEAQKAMALANAQAAVAAAQAAVNTAMTNRDTATDNLNMINAHITQLNQDRAALVQKLSRDQGVVTYIQGQLAAL